jgi:hypothetical protein
MATSEAAQRIINPRGISSPRDYDEGVFPDQLDTCSRLWIAVSHDAIVPVCQAALAQDQSSKELVPLTVFQAAGPKIESIQSSLDAFCAPLGEPNNANDPGCAEQSHGYSFCRGRKNTANITLQIGYHKEKASR